MRPNANFGELWRRLGLRSQTDRNENPPILPSIQPVIPVGDASFLGPAFDMPQALFGFQGSSVAGQFCGCTLGTNAAGGVVIHFVKCYNPRGVSGAASQKFAWGIFPNGATASIATPINLSTVVQLSAKRLLSASGAGTYHNAASQVQAAITAIGSIADVPVFLGGDIGVAGGPINSVDLPGPIYLPPGCVFVLEQQTPGNGLAGCAYFTELPALSPPG